MALGFEGLNALCTMHLLFFRAIKSFLNGDGFDPQSSSHKGNKTQNFSLNSKVLRSFVSSFTKPKTPPLGCQCQALSGKDKEEV